MGERSEGVTDYKQYYADKLAGALEFQDWVQDMLYDRGISVGAYSSKKYQCNKGENRAGIEIKFDQKWRDTGRFYIETDEKSNPSRTAYVRSGIYRDDNTWLYVIGDYSKAFVFAKTHLIHMDNWKRDGKLWYRHVENKTKTSKGFLMPVEDAEKYAAKIITPNPTNAN